MAPIGVGQRSIDVGAPAFADVRDRLDDRHAVVCSTGVRHTRCARAFLFDGRRPRGSIILRSLTDRPACPRRFAATGSDDRPASFRPAPRSGRSAGTRQRRADREPSARRPRSLFRRPARARAISVWTRVLFLDRGHARAKAYIDRARSASPNGSAKATSCCIPAPPLSIAATPARHARLLTSAVERGASHRGSARPARAAEPARARQRRRRRRALDPRRGRAATITRIRVVAGPDRAGSSRATWLAMGVLAGLAAAGVVAWVALARPDWLPVHAAPIAVRARCWPSEPLPVPARGGDGADARAPALRGRPFARCARGRSTPSAMAIPFAREADELTAMIQRRLLETARITTAGRRAARRPR